jgi:formamidopyrimidine-DNA glycosylase
MPELPEVETIVRGLRDKVLNKRIEDVQLFKPQILRCDPKDFHNCLKDQTITGITRRGKFIIFELSNGWSLLVHLKMTGQFKWTHQKKVLQKHTHAIIHLSTCSKQLHYCDIRRFGYMMLLQTACRHETPPLKDLGPEPLDISESAFVELAAQRRGRLKSLLLNQGFLAGLGNIYADESLWKARIHPLTLTEALGTRKLRQLHRSIQAVLSEAIDHKGSSVDNYRDTEGLPGEHQFHLKAYGRQGQPCFHCGSKIRRIVFGGRSSFFCPRCQRQLRGHSL